MVTEGPEVFMEQRPCDEIIFDPYRGKLVMDLWAVARHPIRFLRIFGPFLTAHHPFCSHFEGHTLNIRNRKFCVGCLFNSLSFFVTFFLLMTTWFLDASLIVREYLFWGGVLGIAVSLLLSSAGLTERIKVKIGAKLLLGSGFAAICVSILIFGGNLLVQSNEKVLLILLMFLSVMTILNGKRMWEIEQECLACEYRMRWSKCPGFKDIVCKSIDAGFVKPKEKRAQSN